MLNYMSGIDIGKSRRKSGGAQPKRKKGSARKQALKKHFKSSLKDLHKLSPKEAVKHAKAVRKQLSPLNKMRMNKALKEARKKELQIEQGEPFNIDMPETPESSEFVEDGMEEAEEGGESEVNEPEFSEEGSADSDTGGEDMGMIYPEAISGKAERKAKKQAKTGKKQAKADLTRSKGEAKKMKAQAKMTKAEKGGSGKGREIFDSLKDTADKFANKGKGGEENAPEPSWFEKNKMLVLGGGALLLIGGGTMLSKRGKK